ncbi:radical SAM protein [Candidatus Bathyarchaeota archaeon]|nr:MAG: radical SAM protein [Candidatus Bathyarchaeota archaeon]
MKKYAQVLLYLFWLELKRIIFGVKYSVEVDVTDNCNLRCKHCYHFHGKDDFKTQELSIHVWEKRFNELYKSGIRNILLVGGEPALRIDVLMLADRIFPFVYVITNGTIKIPEEFNHRLYVSIDGSRKTNDSLRGKGVFSRVMKNYSGDKRVVINMTITRDNYKELEDVVKIAKESGFKGVVCNICAGGTDVSVPMVVRKKERKTIIKELKRVKASYPKDFLLSKAMIKWYEYPDHRGLCHWGDEVLHFDVSWNRRRCFGNNADCSNCGCLAGAFQSPLRMLRHLREIMKIAVCS